MDLGLLPRPEMDLADWVKVYPGFGFVMTAREENVPELLREFERAGIDAADVGEVDASRVLRIARGGEARRVFDFRKEGITGISGPSQG
ncbi:MAG: hypothetical protein GXO65_00055 [Euryarchaeota archaeon]|nr:hypothetical protein [Euryarchaeota archaeon]